MEKDIDCNYLIPVKVQIDNQKHKQWIKNWFPIFEKMSISKESFISKLNYYDSSDNFSDFDNPIRRRFNNDKNLYVKNGILNLIVPETMTSDLTIQWKHFELPFDWSKTKMFKLGKFVDSPFVEVTTYMKLTFEIHGNDNELFYTSFSARFGTLDSMSNTQSTSKPLVGNKTYGAMDNIFLADSIGHGSCIEIPFFPCRNNYGFNRLECLVESRPFDRTGCIFKAKIGAVDIPKISKMVAKIEWIDPKQ